MTHKISRGARLPHRGGRYWPRASRIECSLFPSLSVDRVDSGTSQFIGGAGPRRAKKELRPVGERDVSTIRPVRPILGLIPIDEDFGSGQE